MVRNVKQRSVSMNRMRRAIMQGAGSICYISFIIRDTSLSTGFPGNWREGSEECGPRGREQRMGELK